MDTDPAERIRQGKKRVSRRSLPATRHGLNTDQFVEDPKTTAQKGPTYWTPTWNLSGDRRSIPATRSVDETDPHMGHPTIIENTDPSTRIQDGEESVNRRIIPVTPNGEESVRRRIIPATPDGEETDQLGSVDRRFIPAAPSDDTNYGEDYPTDDDLIGDGLLDEDTTPSNLPALEPIPEGHTDEASDDDVEANGYFTEQSGWDGNSPPVGVKTGIFSNPARRAGHSSVIRTSDFSNVPPVPDETTDPVSLTTVTTSVPVDPSDTPDPLPPTATPVFTPAQIEAIIAGDFEGICRDDGCRYRRQNDPRFE
ncbi:unnamed protein product [Aphanomyces euteiches]